MSTKEILLSAQDFFATAVEEACVQRKIKTYPQVKNYLVRLLEFYLDARNLHEDEMDESGKRKPQTLAEMYLIAQNSDHTTKLELLKKLGDKSLYLSGFFSESFARKIIDVDYYVDMGGTAYAQLASSTKEDGLSKVYSIFSQRFVEFSDVLTCISHNSQVENDQNVLRLYDLYLRTGSELAKEKLLQKGVIPVSTSSPQASKSHKLS